MTGFAISIDSGVVVEDRRLREAVARGCTRAHRATFSDQARPFYERLDDYPPGHQRFMEKALVR